MWLILLEKYAFFVIINYPFKYNINGDKMLLRELQTFDVVNVIDGDKLGRIIDLEINYDTGKILSFTVSPNTFVSFFMKNKNIVIPWENVVKVGTEVIIVNHEVE